MLEALEGSQAIARAVALCRPDVVAAYPITPQTHIVENLSKLIKLKIDGEEIVQAPDLEEPKILNLMDALKKSVAEAGARSDELPSLVDVRQMSLFGAGWTLGSLQALADGGADSVTFYETIGWRGVLETTRGSKMPDKFQSVPGGAFPMYHVLADVGGMAGAEVIPTTTSAPLQVVGMTLRRRSRTRARC